MTCSLFKTTALHKIWAFSDYCSCKIDAPVLHYIMKSVVINRSLQEQFILCWYWNKCWHVHPYKHDTWTQDIERARSENGIMQIPRYFILDEFMNTYVLAMVQHLLTRLWKIECKINNWCSIQNKLLSAMHFYFRPKCWLVCKQKLWYEFDILFIFFFNSFLAHL